MLKLTFLPSISEYQPFVNKKVDKKKLVPKESDPLEAKGDKIFLYI